MKVLITGSAGLIGFFLAQALLARGDEVVGIDNFNDYYNPALKQARLIGNKQPVTLRTCISVIEAAFGKKAVENHLPMQPRDVPLTYANIDGLMADTRFKPQTRIEDGIGRFVEWFKPISLYTSFTE